MRTTLNLDDALVRRAKKAAADRGTTLTSLVEEALRAHLAPRRGRRGAFKLQLLIKHGTRRPGVDPSDRDRLYELMEGRS